jgi:hypothetical protein
MTRVSLLHQGQKEFDVTKRILQVCELAKSKAAELQGKIPTRLLQLHLRNEDACHFQIDAKTIQTSSDSVGFSD